MQLIKIFFLSMFLVPFGFCMNAEDEPRGRDRMRRSERMIYFHHFTELLQKTEQLLDGISNDHPFKRAVANTVSVVLSFNGLEKMFSNKQWVDVFLELYSDHLIAYELQEYGSLNGNVGGVTIYQLDSDHKKILMALIMKRIACMLANGEQIKSYLKALNYNY